MGKNPKVRFGTNQYDYDLIIIGAGIGGLGTAAMLAKYGLKILVLEQSSIIGGCCSTYEDEGYKLDVGASIVELVGPMYEVFSRCGRKVEDYMDLIPCDPIYAFVNEKGQKFAYPVDWEATVKVISGINREDGETFRKFANEGRSMIDKNLMAVMGSSMQTLTDCIKMVLKNPGTSSMLPLMASTHDTVISKHFKDPVVLGSMAFQSYFVGAAPELCPGFLGLIALTEHYGIYYPRGGMIAIPNGLAAVAKEYGTEIRTNTLVDRILLSKDKVAKGVRLADGQEITAPVVVSNISALTTYKNLVGRDNLPWHINIGIDSYTPSMGCPMIYLAMDTKPDLNAHHTMLAADLKSVNKVWYDYKADCISRDAGLSLACWPTDADPELSSKPGHHIVNFVYNAPVPYAPIGSNWDLLKNRYLDEGIDFFDRVFSPGIKKHIVYAKVSTPLDFERRLLAPRGCIYGLDFDITTLGPLRPRSRSWAIKNLYLVGASTHMSGGIPTVMSSALITSDLIKHDHL